MKDKLFAELLESVREGGAILREDKVPSRSIEFAQPTVRKIRKQVYPAQSEHAALHPDSFWGAVSSKNDK